MNKQSGVTLLEVLLAMS
ncbi:TPA: prepilin-type N-terminal cleavage/methylation domain-containing protein, partial [Escherichia coli]